MRQRGIDVCVVYGVLVHVRILELVSVYLSCVCMGGESVGGKILSWSWAHESCLGL